MRQRTVGGDEVPRLVSAARALAVHPGVIASGPLCCVLSLLFAVLGWALSGPKSLSGLLSHFGHISLGSLFCLIAPSSP